MADALASATFSLTPKESERGETHDLATRIDVVVRHCSNVSKHRLWRPHTDSYIGKSKLTGWKIGFKANGKGLCTLVSSEFQPDIFLFPAEDPEDHY